MMWYDKLPTTRQVSDGKMIPHIVLEALPDGATITISIEKFKQMIGNVTTHEALSALPFANGGWQKYFDDWKAKGIIS